MMLIKNFQANTIKAALDMVRAEFGREAVVLKTDVVRDGGIKMFCVTAARDQAGDKPIQVATAAHAGENGASPRPALPSNQSVIEPGATVDRIGTSRHELESAILDVVLPELFKGTSRDIFLRLRTHDVTSELAREICRRWQAQEKSSVESLKSILAAIAPLTREWPESGSNIVFIGPCGSGKSTLLAKIATQLVFQEREKVELTTLDNFRPGAEQEISSLNEIVEMVGEAREDFRKRSPKYMLIDTPGIVTGDTEALAELREQLADIKQRFIVAALPLTSNWRQLERFLTFSQSLEIDAVVFTQLDASDSCGAILNYAAAEYPPVWGIADSRQPTDALRDFNINTEFEKLIGEIDD